MWIAGKIRLQSVMDCLSREREVLHSEGDLQHAFGRAIWELDPSIQVRAEIRQPGNAPGRRVLDMSCFSPVGSTAIEFKYSPRKFRGKDRRGEEFDLPQQDADDLLRLGFVKDIFRLEDFCRDPRWSNGLALLVSSVPGLWIKSEGAVYGGQDREFRLYDGATLANTLGWAGQAEHRNARVLRGSYQLRWKNYAPEAEGLEPFKYLAVEIAGSGGQQSWSREGPNA